MHIARWVIYIVVTSILFVFNSLLAAQNSPIVLKELSKPEQVIAFANNPFRDDYSGCISLMLAEESVIDFLKSGEIIPIPKDYNTQGRQGGPIDYLAPVTLPGESASSIESKTDPTSVVRRQDILVCEGIIVTKNNGILFWNLINNRVLMLSNELGEKGFLVTQWNVALQKSPIVIPDKNNAAFPPSPLEHPPAAEDVELFSNIGLPAHPFDRVPRARIAKNVLLHFLRAGKYVKDNSDWSIWLKYRNLASITIESNEIQSLGKHYSGSQLSIYPVDVYPTGVIYTKSGEIFFWRMLNDRVLEIRNEAMQWGFFIVPQLQK